MTDVDFTDAAKAASDVGALHIVRDILGRSGVDLCVFCLLSPANGFYTFRGDELPSCSACLHDRIGPIDMVTDGPVWVRDYNLQRHYGEGVLLCPVCNTYRRHSTCRDTVWEMHSCTRCLTVTRKYRVEDDATYEQRGGAAFIMGDTLETRYLKGVFATRGGDDV